MSLETVSISTSKFITTVKANIDGHVYTVRKMGAGTQLDLSRELTELQKSRTDILNLKAKIEKAESEEKTVELMAQNSKIMENFDNAIKRIEGIFVDLFDDGEDGKKSQKLVHTLGIDNIQTVYNEIFDKAEKVDE